MLLVKSDVPSGLVHRTWRINGWKRRCPKLTCWWSYASSVSSTSDATTPGKNGRWTRSTLIAAEVEALHIKAPERRKKVRDEFQRLSSETELQGLSDEEFRAFAVRYGLQMTVEMKQVKGIQWQRLGSMFSGFNVKGDLEAVDYPMQTVIDAVKVI